MNIVAVFDEVRLLSEHGVIIANDELHTTLILILAFVVIKRAGGLAFLLMLIGVLGYHSITEEVNTFNQSWP